MNLELLEFESIPETTSTKQWGWSFLHKETTWAFNVVWTQEWPITSQTLYPLSP